MVVYIKDLSNEPIARRVMEPLAAEQLHRFPCIFCKELEVREAEFDVAELTRWSKLANRLMLEDVVIAGGAQTHGNAFWGNRFYINVQN